MTTEASKPDSLTAALTQLSHFRLQRSHDAPLVRIHVGGVEIPFLEFSILQGETLNEAYFIVESKHADLLRLNRIVKILEGDPAVAVFTGQLQDRELEGNTIVCRAVAAAADLPLWERKGSLQPLETLPFVEKTTQAD